MTQLNRSQYKAALPVGGVNLIIAGAGTGKTKTLVEKVKNVINYLDIQPGKILILTFSRKAAQEIKERIKSGIGERALEVNSGTFHSFCLNFLKENEEIFIKVSGFNTFPSVLDNDKRRDIINELIFPRLDKFLGLPSEIIYDLINKRDNLNKTKLKKLQQIGLDHEIDDLINHFIAVKKEMGLIDFDDMMKFSINLLKSEKDLRISVISKYTYILVDEFQDTSSDNFELLNLLLPEKDQNLFVVGDDWQSIYGFRNARVEYIINMKKFFPKVKVHKLKINYRSRKEIVKVSNRFIRRNKFRTRKVLVSFKGKGGKVSYFILKAFNEESELISNIITREVCSLSKIAILYRNNRQGEYLRSSIKLEPDQMNNINFMTMHAAKGLEFDVVIIAGVSDKIIPDKDGDIEEERRLFYVALTRARERLYIMLHANENGDLCRFGKELGINK